MAGILPEYSQVNYGYSALGAKEQAGGRANQAMGDTNFDGPMRELGAGIGQELPTGSKIATRNTGVKNPKEKGTVK